MATHQESWASDAFLRDIPKTDLHVHLDGSLRLSTLIELAQKGGVQLPSLDESELRKSVFREAYHDLPEYLEGFRYTVAVMKTASNLERIAFEFAEDNYNEGVRYFEVRFAPQLLAAKGGAGYDGETRLSITQVITAVNAGLLRAKEQFNKTLVSRPGRQDTDLGEDCHYDYGYVCLTCLPACLPACMSDYAVV
jgi:adenosine deaminase